MLSNKSPFKILSVIFTEGFSSISDEGEVTPPTPPEGYWFVISDTHAYLLDNDGDSLVVDILYNIVNSAGDQIIDNSGNFLITQQ